MEDNYINSHLVQWKKLIEASLECFERGDIGEMQKYKDMADSEYEQYMSNETNEMHNESISFGFGNYIVENNIVRFLKKKNKKALSEYKKIIKEYAEIFKDECNAYYHDEKKASEWAIYLRDKEKEENLKR